jgi:hypothetical protein
MLDLRISTASQRAYQQARQTGRKSIRRARGPQDPQNRRHNLPVPARPAGSGLKRCPSIAPTLVGPDLRRAPSTSALSTLAHPQARPMAGMPALGAWGRRSLPNTERKQRHWPATRPVRTSRREHNQPAARSPVLFPRTSVEKSLPGSRGPRQPAGRWNPPRPSSPHVGGMLVFRLRHRVGSGERRESRRSRRRGRPSDRRSSWPTL